MSFFKHERAMVAPRAQIGEGTRIWANANILEGAVIGEHCNIGDGCYVEGGGPHWQSCDLEKWGGHFRWGDFAG